MEMRKVVLKLNIHDDRDKKKAIKAVSSIEGIDSISVDMKESKMTIIGDVDPVVITYKLRKQWGAQIVTVGPAKEEKKETKDTKPEKNKPSEDQIAQIVKFYHEHGQPYHPPPYYVHSVNEDPNACTIC